MELIIAITAIIIGLIALIYQLKEYNKKRVPEFKGQIEVDTNDGDCISFYDFLFKNDGKIVFIDIYINNLTEGQVFDDESNFTFSCYYDKNKKLEGGYSYNILLSEGDDFFYDDRPSSKRLKGNFKVIGFTGPQMGWFTSVIKPVNIEFS
ncbi:hypothetical protein [Salibacter halophilus]|uniref:Uncharacterized protein n=1 Tax=Salibacter halophilus TaxID=1803916 RepID=A0A6N6MA97_9FLAO|nr:hypothetical protein [Salibacter halophilus]KAB1065170.1 hypothetical protein F3059_04245 [Salibacter halophilus]